MMMETMENPLLKMTRTKRTRSFGTSRQQQHHQQRRPSLVCIGLVFMLCLFLTLCSWVLSIAVLSPASVRRIQQDVTAAITVPQDPSVSMMTTTTRIQHHRRPSTASTTGIAKDDGTTKSKKESSARIRRGRGNKGESHHAVTRHGNNDIIKMAATQTPTRDDESDDEESSASSLLDILSSKRRAFWKDDVLKGQVKANADCHGKEELLSILYAAGIMDGGQKNNRNPAQTTTDKSAKYQQWLLDACPKLSPWSDVVEMYGSQPIVVGMETCARYRETLLMMAARNNQTNNNTHHGTAISPLIRVAGLYNTGTNSLQQSLIRNLPKALNQLVNSNNVLLQQVPHGKHMPVKYKYQNLHPAYHRRAPQKYINPGHVLPIVLVRDPYRWMQTTCKRRYDAEWEKDGDHCPNLVRPVFRDQSESNATRMYTVNLKYHAGRHNNLRDEYPSLADMWSTWIRDYLEFTNATGIIEPRLLIRFEDLLFHAEYVFAKILECVGVTPESWASLTEQQQRHGQSFEYIVQKSKVQGDSLDFMGALMKYGRNDEHDPDGGSRIKGMTRHDLLYAAAGRIDGDDSMNHHPSSQSSPPRGLDPKLMEMFRYRHPSTNAIGGQSKSTV